MPNKYVATYYRPGPGALAASEIDTKAAGPFGPPVQILADNLDAAMVQAEDYFGIASRGGSVTVMTADTAAKNNITVPDPAVSATPDAPKGQ